MTGPTVTTSGLGGVFFRAKDPATLAAWYETHFGIKAPGEDGVWFQDAGPTVFSPFDQDTDYFGPNMKPVMFNFRVDDLEGALNALAAVGISEVKERESMEGVGDFGWVEDPEGHRIELWQPAAPPEGH